MAWLEGAIVKKVTRFNPGGNKAQLMDRHDGMVEHIAVSNQDSLFGQFNTPGEACSHFYVRKAGPQGENAGMADFEQYVDTRYVAPAQLEGNHRMLSCETEGGVGTDLSHGWTLAALNRLAWIAYQCSLLHDYPLAPMPNSRPSSRGVGFHRLGVDPWRVSGGELWSSAHGKVCPGAAREKQIPLIILKAQSLAQKNWYDNMTPEDQAALAKAVELGIGNYLKRFYADNSGTGDAIWDDEKAAAVNELAGLATLGAKLDQQTAAINALVAVLTPKS